MKIMGIMLYDWAIILASVTASPQIWPPPHCLVRADGKLRPAQRQTILCKSIVYMGLDVGHGRRRSRGIVDQRAPAVGKH